MDAYAWFRRSVSKLKNYSLPSAATANAASPTNSTKTSKLIEDDERIYGISEQLIEFVKSFSLDTFRNFVIPDAEESGHDGGSSGNVRMDLSDWQETHAMRILSRVKELGQLRFRLCPRYLSEKQFWTIYFTLVRSFVVGYELQAVRLARLEQIRSGSETVSNNNACEVEMSEAKLIPSLNSATSTE